MSMSFHFLSSSFSFHDFIVVVSVFSVFSTLQSPKVNMALNVQRNRKAY